MPVQSREKDANGLKGAEDGKLQLHSIRVDSSGVRKEMLDGVEHLVVPIVALVEGVLQAANSPVAELALAKEFGRFPQGWNGRPVTLGHPKDGGEFISVSQSPKAFEKNVIGFLFNTRVEDKKLKTEAWINMDKVARAGEEVQKEIARLERGEPTEVSTGVFVSTQDIRGNHNGREYSAVWKDIHPDHLAILHEGVIGACSIADGCGAPRTNCAGGCSCGGSCGGGQKGNDEVAMQRKTVLEAFQSWIKAIRSSKVTDVTQKGSAQDFLPNDADAMRKVAIQNSLQQEAVTLAGGNAFPYITGLTDTEVHYTDHTGQPRRRGYTFAPDNTVALGEANYDFNPKEVPQMSEKKKALVDKILANEASGFVEGDREWLMHRNEAHLETLAAPASMDPKNKEADTSDDDADDNTDTQDKTPPKKAAPKDNLDGDADSGIKPGDDNKKQPATAGIRKPSDLLGKAPAMTGYQAKSVQEFLDMAPPEMREVLSSGLKMHQSKRAELVKALKANSRNKFSDAQLNGFDIATLENLHHLATQPIYAGAAGSAERFSAAGGDDEEGAPQAPRAFEAPDYSKTKQ